MTTTDTMPTNLAHLRISKFSLKKQRDRLFASSHARHQTAWEASCWLLRPRYERRETGTSARSCDVARHGNPLWNASIQPPSRRHRLSRSEPDSCKLHWERKLCRTTGRSKEPPLDKDGKTMPWRSADLDFAPGAPRKQCSVFTLLPMKTVTLWKTKTSQASGSMNIGVQFFTHAPKVRDITKMKTSCDTFRVWRIDGHTEGSCSWPWWHSVHL